MYCLKCGRETENEQVFCNACLEIMGKYPVKPGTHINLPKRETAVVQKKSSRRRALKPEEQVIQLKRSLRRTRFIVVLLILAVVGMGVFNWWHMKKLGVKPEEEAPIGQNFTVEPTTTLPVEDDVSRETIPSLTISPTT